MNTNIITISGIVRRFTCKNAWYYVELPDSMSNEYRPLLMNVWPALLRASFTVKKTNWISSIMPIKDGPLFIALPAKVRKAEGIEQGQTVTIDFELIV